MISGVMMAMTASVSSDDNSYKTLSAATIPEYKVPNIPYTNGAFDLPDDLVRDLAIKKGFLDTTSVTTVDPVVKTVTKVKWKMAPRPDPVIIRDTLIENHYYLATQIGNKEDQNGDCIPVYEIRKVNEICAPNDTDIRVENDVGE
jgi:hypothetical protein